MLMKNLWDHTIEMKEGSILRKRKVYPLLREEREEMCKFIEKQLRKGYIRPSKSSQTALVFFIGKKNGKKQMVWNYRYLNEQTIKNNYPLIKKGDEQKVTFMTSEGLFESVVMFFGLTNFPAMFQTIINEIL